MTYRSLFAAILVICFAPSLQAQVVLAEGMKIRFTTTSNQKLTGVVRARIGDSVTVYTAPNGVPATVGLSSIRKLQVSRGKSAIQGAKKGALWGAGVGAVLVGVLASGDCSSPYGASCDDQIREGPGALGIGALGGAVCGTLIGSLVRSEKWETLANQPTVGITKGGLKLGLKFW